jgi:Bifunctional DNA primase/polymerase, N-terminal
MSDLRIAAEVYHHEFGWSVIPVAGKRPRVAWKQAPPWQEVAERFDDPRTTGVAVILGKPSRDLVVRDFDKPEAYERWKRDHPELAKTLPIARTGRAEGGYHVYGTMPGAPLVKLPDGELRGNGGIVVLPPSGHPSGATYKWIKEPSGQPSLVTPEQLNAEFGATVHSRTNGADPKHTHSDSEQTQADSRNPEADSCTTQDDPKQPQADTSIACVEYHASIEKCIVANLPDGPGQRNRCLFGLAQDLREFLPKDTPERFLIDLVMKWHAHASPFIHTKGIVESINDFLIAWKKVQWPSGNLWHGITEAASNDTFTLGDDLSELDATARLLRALAHHHSGGPFHLSARKLAKAIGVKDPKSALANMRVLVALELVELVEKGESKPGGKASVWRWIGSPIESPALESAEA